MTATADLAPLVLPGRRSMSLPSLIDREKGRKRNRRILWIVVVALVVIAAAVTGIVLRPKPVPLSARFRTETASVGDILREVRASGRVEAQSTVNVGAEVSGRIATVDVDFNEHVTVGQVMATFDRASFTAQLDQITASIAAARAAMAQATTDLRQSTRNLGRIRTLHVARAVSDAEYDAAVFSRDMAATRVRTARAQLAAQQAAATLARTNLAHTVIRAPIDGIVISRNVDPGQTVISAFQSSTLFALAADLRQMRVIAAVDEADIGRVASGQGATFTVNAFPDRVFEGMVVEVRNAPAIVQDVVTYGTEIVVENPDRSLKPGMTASVRIRTGTARGVLRVPNSALRFTPPGRHEIDGNGVWQLRGSDLRAISVRPGLSDGQWTEIETGPIAAGQPVIVELTHAGRRAYGLAR